MLSSQPSWEESACSQPCPLALPTGPTHWRWICLQHPYLQLQEPVKTLADSSYPPPVAFSAFGSHIPVALCRAPVLWIICPSSTDLPVSFSPQPCVPEGDMTGCGKTFSSVPPCLPGLPVLLRPAQEGQGSSPYPPAPKRPGLGSKDCFSGTGLRA